MDVLTVAALLAAFLAVAGGAAWTVWRLAQPPAPEGGGEGTDASRPSPEQSAV